MLEIVPLCYHKIDASVSPNGISWDGSTIFKKGKQKSEAFLTPNGLNAKSEKYALFDPKVLFGKTRPF